MSSVPVLPLLRGSSWAVATGLTTRAARVLAGYDCVNLKLFSEEHLLGTEMDRKDLFVV